MPYMWVACRGGVINTSYFYYNKENHRGKEEVLIRRGNKGIEVLLPTT